MLGLQVLVFAFLVAGSYGVVQRYGPSTVSFVGFYAAGELAADGYPQLAYDETILYENEEDLTRPGIFYTPFLYPPVYLLLCAPLALLPFQAAFIIFEAATLPFYLLVVRYILRARGRGWLWPALAFPATFWTIGYGQNGFLTAALFGAGTLLIDQRPAMAGVWFGMLCYKPHFGLLIPIALIAGRRWRAVTGAAVSVGFLVGLSLALFGWQTWRAYLGSFFGSAATYDFEIERHVNIFASVSPFAAALLLGFSTEHARIAQLVATSLVVLLVGWVWRKNATLPIRAAALAAGAVVAVPYALIYDLMIAAIAGSWLLRAGCDGGFLPRGKAGARGGVCSAAVCFLGRHGAACAARPACRRCIGAAVSVTRLARAPTIGRGRRRRDWVNAPLAFNQPDFALPPSRLRTPAYSKK